MAKSCSKFILIGRNQSKLDAVEKELKAIRTDVVIEQKVIDFSTFEDYSGLRMGFFEILKLIYVEIISNPYSGLI